MSGTLVRLNISNFRCFPSLEVPLRPLTVLIGANDTGKSSFLTALRYLYESFGKENDTRGIEGHDAWRGSPVTSVAIIGTNEKGHELSKKGSGSTAWWPNGGARLQFYQLPSCGVNMQSAGYSDTGDPPEIHANGSNIPALLDHLIRTDRKRFDGFVASLKSYVPGLEDVLVSTPNPAERKIDFKIENGFRIAADNTSVGLRLMVFFVALSFHPQPPEIILLEEPENGVHPRRLKDIVNLLRDMTKGSHGAKPTQVILSTHSPFLLDQVDLDQDQVLVFRRQDDGSRTAEPVDAQRLKTFLDEFMLGEVWFNQGEEGLVKRVKS